MTAEGIAAAALRAFARYGFDGMSVRMLARELGVAPNVITQRFGSKEQLWRAAVDQGFGGLVDALAMALREAPEDPLDRLRAGIRAFVVYSGEHPELLGVMNSEGALNTPRLDYVFDTYIGPATAPLAVVLDELAEAGLLRRVPLRTLHFLIACGGAAPFTLDALTHRLDPAADPVSPDRIADHADLVAAILVDGLRPAAHHAPRTEGAK